MVASDNPRALRRASARGTSGVAARGWDSELLDRKRFLHDDIFEGRCSEADLWCAPRAGLKVSGSATVPSLGATGRSDDFQAFNMAEA